CYMPSTPPTSFVIHLLLLMTPPPPTSTLFPYTTLFRSTRRSHLSPACVCGCTIGSPTCCRRAWRASSSHCSSAVCRRRGVRARGDRESTRLNSSHPTKSYAGFCFEKKKKDIPAQRTVYE